MSIAWIRDHYGVPAKRGLRVTVDGRPGEIIGSTGAHLRVRFDQGHGIRAAASRRVGHIFSCHPTWRVDYLDGIDYSARHEARVEAFVAALNHGRTDDTQEGERG